MSRERAPRGPLLCFILGGVCTALFAVAYVLDWGTPALGATIGTGLAFVALGTALWSNLIDKGSPTYVEERAVGPSAPSEFRRLVSAIKEQPVPRSGVLWGALGGSLGMVGLVLLFPLRSLIPNMHTQPEPLLRKSPWARGTKVVTEEDETVKPSDLPIGGVMTVYPKGYDKLQAAGATLLIRVPADKLRLPRGRRGWDVDGVIAYSKLCSHAGCPVGLYGQETHQLLCPCHHSVFDVLDGAQPMEGPAAHPLPQLPLAVDSDGDLVAAGPFSGPVGAAWWGVPS